MMGPVDHEVRTQKTCTKKQRTKRTSTTTTTTTTTSGPIYYLLLGVLILSLSLTMELPLSLLAPRSSQNFNDKFQLTASAFSIGRFGWPGLEWREIMDWWTSGYSRGVVIGRNYIPPCKLCDMPRMFRVDK